MADNLEDFFDAPVAQPNTLGFSEPVGNSTLEDIFDAPSLEEAMDQEPADLPAEAADEDFHFMGKVYGALSQMNPIVKVAGDALKNTFDPETWRGVGASFGASIDEMQAGLALQGLDQAEQMTRDAQALSFTPEQARKAMEREEEYLAKLEEGKAQLRLEAKAAIERQAANTPKDLNLWQQGLRGAALSAPQALAGIGLSALARSPAPALALAGGTVFGTSKAGAEVAGHRGVASTAKGLLDAGIEVAFEFLPTGKTVELLQAAAHGKPDVIAKAVDVVKHELVGEQATTAAQTLANVAFQMDTEMANAETWQEKLKLQADRQIVTLISTALLSGATSGGIAAMTSPKEKKFDSNDQPIPEVPFNPEKFTGPLVSNDLRTAQEYAETAEKKFQRLIEEGAQVAEMVGQETPTDKQFGAEPFKQAGVDHLVGYQEGTWTPIPQLIEAQEKPTVYTTDHNDWLEHIDQIRQEGTPEAIEKATNMHLQLMRFADTMQQSKKVMQKWQEQFMPGVNIVLTSMSPQARPDQLGAARLSKGVARISLHPFNDNQSQFSEAMGYHLLAHEFGHVFMMNEFGKLGPKAKAALELDYQQWLGQQTPEISFAEHQGMRATPDELAMIRPRTDITMGQIEQALPEKHAVFVSREEFFAQQMAKYQTYNKKAQAVSKPFFSQVVAKLRKFFKTHGDEFAPTQTFEAWLDTLSAKNKVARLEATEQTRQGEVWENIRQADIAAVSPPKYAVANMAETKYRFDEWQKVFGPMGIQPAQAAKTLGQKLGSPAWQAALDKGIDNMNRFKKNFRTLEQNARNNPHIPGLLASNPDGTDGFMRNIDEAGHFKRREAERNNEFLGEWRSLGSAQASKVGELAMRADELSREKGMKITPMELAYEARLIGINQSAFDLYVKMEKSFERKLDQLNEALTARANRKQWTDEGGKASYLRQLQSRVSAMQSRNYFPSMRFGEHIVLVKAEKDGIYNNQYYRKGDTLLREHFETPARADERAAQLKKQNIGQANVVGRDKIPDYNAMSYQGMPPALLEELMRRLPESEHKAIADAMAATAPGQGFAKRMIQKEGISGASKNFRKSYLSYMESFDRHLSRMMFEDQLDSNIQAVHESAQNLVMQGKDASTRRQVQEMMVDTKEYLFNPGEEFRAWGAAAFQFHLAGVPKHAALALIQIPMVSLPNLTAQYGTLAASRAMQKAISRIYDKKFDPASLPLPLQEALHQAEVDAVLEQTMGKELAMISNSGNLDRLVPNAFGNGDNVAHYWGMFSSLAAGMFHHGEKLARQITFHTAWELEYALSGDTVAAYSAAKDAVSRGHYNFTAVNNAPIMRGKVRPLFVFQSHIQGTLDLMFGKNNPGRWRAMAMLLMAAGLTGLPGADDVSEVIDWCIKKYNSNRGDYSTVPDVRENIRGNLVEIMDFAGHDSAKLIADLMMDGTGKWGFGLPWLSDVTGVPLGSFDITPSLGMGQVVPGIKAINAPDFNTGVAQMTEGALGPAFGIPLGMVQAMYESNASGDWRMGKFMPAMVRNPKTAADYMEGSAEDKYGTPVVDFDKNNPQHQMDAVWQAAGLIPTRLSVERDARWAATKTNEYYSAVRTILTMQMEEAIKAQSPEAISDMIRNIQEFNKTVPNPGYMLNPVTIRTGVGARMKAEEKAKLGIPQRAMDTMATQEIRNNRPTAD